MRLLWLSTAKLSLLGVCAHLHRPGLGRGTICGFGFDRERIDKQTSRNKFVAACAIRPFLGYQALSLCPNRTRGVEVLSVG